MIINIHGYNFDKHLNPGKNNKYEWLSNTYNDEIVSIDIDYNSVSPKQITDILIGKIKLAEYNEKTVNIVGNSLGGFIGLYLHCIYPNINTVLFNPSLVPFISLKGVLPNWILEDYLSLFGYIYEKPEYNFNKLHVFISRDDERIDHEKTTLVVLYNRNYDLIKVEGGHNLKINDEIKNIIIKNKFIESELLENNDSGVI